MKSMPWVFGAFLLVFASPALAQSDAPCVLSRVEGTTSHVLREGKSLPAQSGMGIISSDSLRTGDASRMTLHCTSGVVVTIGPDTWIAVDKVAPQQGEIRLFDGIAGFVLNWRKPGVFQIRTPSAIAAVRSTEWAMQVKSGATSVFVRDGSVDVTARKGGASLGPGDGIDVSDQSVAEPVKRWGQARIDLCNELLGHYW
ncbi:FecR family protein [Roseovarius sp. Pro17]|uniref:FecR family protein n=1 Tax=Roseovarius sp. Pro17 TaxID=3108175 RepID=UPI002D78D563|nr:FecR family protein [Roseovarius sp. Pro17]